ncbi:putative staphylococcal-like nuclease CAN1 [Canna indica]|uniref:Staphylococcal-like nuclease CAN1 n=1 Tax=Canna indica TaxID=4628 RepID=A0AAQ3JV67_9LILI|nr:putative staphylococcal-like nuclease CAN1 [Canna indica]
MGNSLLKFLRGDCRDDNIQVVVVRERERRVAALGNDLFNFEISSQVPEGLSHHVDSSKRAQAIWYKKLLEAWKSVNPTPKIPEEAATLVILTLRGNPLAELEGLLSYYGLPIPPNYNIVYELALSSSSSSSPLNEGGQLVLHTLPVDVNDVGDGDGITVYVDTADPRESAAVPIQVQEAATRAARNFAAADKHQKTIKNAGYQFRNDANGNVILAKKYRIRLQGIDAPEIKMPYGKEAKEQLAKLVNGKCLKIKVYNIDRYGRSVGDVYCNGIFVQEHMLKRGFAWHYAMFDKRPEFARWQKEARAARLGLWAAPNPEKPWEWRRDKRNAGWRGGSSIPIEVY